MFTDIVGFTAMLQHNEEQAVTAIKRHNNLIENLAAVYHGEITNYYGDGCLCIFSSATEAVQCAREFQRELQTGSAVPVRIGIHIGEVFYENGKALGDGINVTSRIQSLGQANTIFFSAEIQDKIKNNAEFKSISLGIFEFKDVDRPLEVFALANEGLFVPKKSRLGGKLTKKNILKRNVILILSIILIILSAFLVYRNYSLKKISITNKSIAILSFVDLSPNHDQEYLGDGIAEAIITSLSHIKDFKVIGRTSSFSFKGKNMDLVTIGKMLSVGIILEGSVQKIGEQVRITAQLIKASDGAHIWSESYKRKLDETFDVQDEISQRITEQIQVNLTDREKNMLVSATTTKTGIYEDYLKGQYYAFKLTPWGIDSAFYFFNKVLRKDPNYAPAYAGLAVLWGVRMQQGISQFKEAEPKMKEAALRAKELDSTLAEVHYMLAGYAWQIWDWSNLRKEMEQAILINPNYALAHATYSNFLYVLGHPEESEVHSLKAIELEPINSLYKALYCMNLMYVRKYDKAVRILENNLKITPEDEQTLTTLKTAYHLNHQYFEAIQVWKKSFELKGDHEAESVLTGGYNEGGYKKALQRLAEFYIKKSKRPWSIATLYTRAGIKNEALEWLQKANEVHDSNMPYLKVDPIFDILKEDPRYDELLQKMNLPN
jgi:TolB-like protein/tetratricopeptide (TPR) repeat protein